MSSAIAEVPRERLAVFAVWIPMLPGDNADAAEASAAILDGVVTAQFFDAEALAGRAIAASLDADGQIAWDIYLTYAREALWMDDHSPLPAAFAHQLSGSWADQARYFTGDGLRRELSAMVRAMV